MIQRIPYDAVFYNKEWLNEYQRIMELEIDRKEMLKRRLESN